MKGVLRILVVALLLVSTISAFADEFYSEKWCYSEDDWHNLYLIGDFNNWQLPTKDNDNGAVKAGHYYIERFYPPTNKLNHYQMMRYFPEGEHSLAVYRMRENEILKLRPNRFGSGNEVNNDYVESGWYIFTSGFDKLSLSDYSLEEAVNNAKFNVDIKREGGMWLIVSWNFNGFINMSVAGDSSFGLSLNKSASLEDVEESAENEADEYFNLDGVKTENPHDGIFVKKSGNSSSKVLIK